MSDIENQINDFRDSKSKIGQDFKGAHIKNQQNILFLNLSNKQIAKSAGYISISISFSIIIINLIIKFENGEPFPSVLYYIFYSFSIFSALFFVIFSYKYYRKEKMKKPKNKKSTTL